MTKRAWAGTEGEARILLQQVFLTHQVENGRCKIGVAAPQDARDRLTVDYEISVPRQIALEVSTTFGDITAQGARGTLTAKSTSGDVALEETGGGEGGETRVNTASGAVRLSHWNTPGGNLVVETSSGDVDAQELTGETLSLSSRSGDLQIRKAQASRTATYEATSGDVSVSGGSAGTHVHIRTQSGHATANSLKSEQVQVETVSGDAEICEVSGTLTVKTVSGDVLATGVDSPAVSLLTVSGDARWGFQGPFSGSFAGTTVSGDLTLDLSARANARIEMNTTSGGLAISLPVADVVLTDKHAAGKLGEGVGSIRLQSVSGDLTIAEAA